MRLLDRIVAIILPPDAAGEGAPPPRSRANHALLVFVPTSPGAAAPSDSPARSRERAGGPSDGAADLRVLQERVSRAMILQHAGRFEGIEPAESGIVLAFGGPNADRLAAVALPLLRAARLPVGTTVTRRFGAPGARELHTTLTR